MNHRERFQRVMAFEKADRLPVIEFAEWWDKTLDRWRKEGLPLHLQSNEEIRDHFGLDSYRQWWISPFRKSCPEPETFGAGLVKNAADYERMKPLLYPDPPFPEEEVLPWAKKQAKGNAVIWITLEGFFWFPRTLFGIEPHLYAFYDEPELMHEMNRDLVRFHLRAIQAFCEICTPDFMTFAEDMSYKAGSMISKAFFLEFLAPYYRKVVPELKARGTIPLVDSDGNVTQLIPWLEEVGIEGILPLERRAGVDIVGIREKHPRFRMIGGFDKYLMNRGEEEIRKEFERILPVMHQGGFIPSPDHQTPPEVSLEEYGIYLRLLNEYCRKGD